MAILHAEQGGVLEEVQRARLRKFHMITFTRLVLALLNPRVRSSFMLSNLRQQEILLRRYLVSRPGASLPAVFVAWLEWGIGLEKGAGGGRVPGTPRSVCDGGS